VRIRRNFAFVDVSGFTALTEVEGDERAVEVLAAFRLLLREICSRRGVRIAKWLGDGAMLVCVNTRPLLEAVLELHYVVNEVSGADPVATVSIRTGITSGDVILMEGDDYVGHCVNVASRLCDLAAPGEALAAPSVLEHLPSWGTVAAENQVDLRGVGRPVSVSSIRMDCDGSDGARDPICGLPLSHDTAEEIAHDVRGALVLFCSPSCVDTWRRRPAGTMRTAGA
jgi:class 3 adenylate cyclase/YHS domain-containing protein